MNIEEPLLTNSISFIETSENQYIKEIKKVQSISVDNNILYNKRMENIEMKPSVTSASPSISISNIEKRKSFFDKKEERVIRLFQSHVKEHDIFPKNIVITSRYTIISFIPKCLLEQFRRLANVYFLVVGGIAAVGAYTNYFDTSVAPEGILLPMLAVISISMVKEGIEDMKRHRKDAKINSQLVSYVKPDGFVEKVEWQQLKVGDLVLLVRDDDIPADIVPLQCGGVQGPLVYVETAAIDGETNLKIRDPCFSHHAEFNNIVAASGDLTTIPIDKLNLLLSTNQDRNYFYGVHELRERVKIETEPPNESIYNFNGRLSFFNSNSNNVDEIIPLSEKNLLLRGSVIRATEWCVGIVVFTGRDTKLSQNSKMPPSKLSSVDRVVNKTLLITITVMIAVCILSMIFSIVWLADNGDAKYLCLQQSDLSNVYTDGGGCESSATSSELTFFTFITLYNNFVCISMYVSLEMVYLCQAYFIGQDITLYDEYTKSKAECHSSGMCADLGQIQYVLSDKTGTLTKNVMKLRRCSVNGVLYGADIGANHQSITKEHDNNSYRPISIGLKSVDEERMSSGTELSLQSVYKDSLSISFESTEFVSRPMKNSEKNWHPLFDMHPSKLDEPDKCNIMLDFIRVVAYCNTVMLMPDSNGKLNVNDFNSLELCLQAESADEVALVLAAAQYSKVFLTSRHDKSATLMGLRTYEGNDSEYVEILAVNEFESFRKRMSVLLKVGDRYVLLCKGADSSMLSICNSSNLTNSVISHTELFAGSGLRTLIAARKELSFEEVSNWLTIYHEAKNSVHYRADKLRNCAEMIEYEMDILGSIGIEDELQDGVSEAIETLKASGLNVWMITGDKAETAIAIAKMCSLIGTDNEIEKCLNLDGVELRQKIVSMADRAVQLKSKDNQITSITSTESPFKIKESNALEHFSNKSLTLVIDGITFENLWKAPDLKIKLALIIQNVTTVIACRVSPLQKATLVRMVKATPGNPITLAIGDGANDVGMIHAARVGVGINGKEGRHASNSADFAIGQFRFLVPMLLEHGRFNYIRCSKLVLYSFFKNLLLVSILFYYCIFSGFSGTIPLESLVFTGYNFYLGLPIVAFGAFDYDVPRLFVYKYPALAYDTGRRGELLNLWNMLRWCILAFVIGLLLFILSIRVIGGPIIITTSHEPGNTSLLGISGLGLIETPNGWNTGIYVEGLTIFSIAIVAMQYKVTLMTTTRNSIYWFTIALSMSGYFLFVYIYGLVPSTSWYNVAPITLNLSSFWLAIFCIPIVVSLCDTTIDQIFSLFYQTSQEKLATIYLNENMKSEI